MTYAYTDLKNSVANSTPYKNIGIALDMRTILNDAVREVNQELDLASCKRRYSTQLSLFDEVYSYSCPADLKGVTYIDMYPQLDRDPQLDWIVTTDEEFDRRKSIEANLTAIKQENNVKRLMVSIATVNWMNSVINDTPLTNINIKSQIISILDSLSENGQNWQAFGDADNLRINNVNYVKGNGSMEFDINSAGGTTAGIYHSNLGPFDITDFIEQGYALVFARINSPTNITNYKLRIGVDASNYYELTATTTVEGLAFASGWNLISFSFSSASLVGTVDITQCKYVAAYMTKDGAKVSENYYGFDQIQLKAGNFFTLDYYTDYPWQTSAGVYIVKSTADTDVLNAGEEEFNLMVAKGKEKMFLELREYNQVTYWASQYNQLVNQYKMNNPSQAKVLTTVYREF